MKYAIVKTLICAVVELAMLVPSVAGASTKLTTTWRDSSVSTIPFKKVVVAFISKDADLRRRVEDGLARRVPRLVAANTVVPAEELMDREAVKARLVSNGFDGAMVVRLVDMQRETVVSQGETWYAAVPTLWQSWGYWDTWDTGWMTVNTATYVYEDRTVTADILLYSVATAKPIWVGRLTAHNPKNLRILLDDLVKAGSKELKKQKLV